MQTNNTQTAPLWKVLNEQRNNDEVWEARGRFIESSEYGTIAQFDKGYSGNKEDAQYTALAVNNLHRLAEALEEALDQLESWNPEGNPSFTMMRVKEALNRIS